MDHGFRKRFNIILKLNNDINSNIAEKILGHSVTIPLDNTYLPAQNPEVLKKCFEEFKKAIPELTIDDSERNKMKIKNQNKKISELETTKEDNKLLQNKILHLEQESNNKYSQLEKQIRMLQKTNVDTSN